MISVVPNKIGDGFFIRFAPPTFGPTCHVLGFQTEAEAEQWLHSFIGKVWLGTVASANLH